MRFTGHEFETVFRASMHRGIPLAVWIREAAVARARELGFRGDL